MKNIKVTLTFNKKAQGRDELGDILVSFDWKGEHYDWELMEQLSYSAYKMMIWLDDSSDELDFLINDAGMDEKSAQAIKTAIRNQAEVDAMQAWWPLDPGVMPIAYNNKVKVSVSPGALYGDSDFWQDVEFEVNLATNFDSSQDSGDLKYENFSDSTPTSEYIYNYEDVIPFVKKLYEEKISSKHKDLEWNTDLEQQVRSAFIASAQGYQPQYPGNKLDITPKDFISGMQFTGLEDLYAYLGQKSGLGEQIKHLVKIQYDYNGIFTNSEFDFNGVGTGYSTAPLPLRECFPEMNESEVDQIEKIFNGMMDKINQIQPATDEQVQAWIAEDWTGRKKIEDLGDNPNMTYGIELAEKDLNIQY